MYGKYGKWLLSLYQRKKLNLEDLYKATEYLTYFNKYNKQLDEKDINKYKSLPELYNALKDIINNENDYVSNSEKIRQIKKGAEKVYEDNQWLIVIPHTEEASCYYGKGTQWCTAAEKSNNYFSHYSSQGNLYINIDKINNKKYQFHFESESFMDENDEPIEMPIAKTINLSDGAIKWYMKNVKEYSLLLDESIDLLVSDDYEYKLIRKYKNYNNTWVLKDTLNNIEIAYDLIINKDEINKKSDDLFYKHFCYFKNINNLYTLIYMDINTEVCYNITNLMKSVGIIESIYNNTYFYIDGIDYEGKYRIYCPYTGERLYTLTNNSLIYKTEFVSYECLGIFKKNNTIDIINFDGYEIDDVPFEKEDDIDLDDDNNIIINNKNGKTIKINSEYLEYE